MVNPSYVFDGRHKSQSLVNYLAAGQSLDGVGGMTYLVLESISWEDVT